LLVLEKKLVAENPETDRLSWRELAIARSLDSARIRAEGRVQRFLDAAIELLAADPSKNFTVQEVVERSGQSLRSFYQYFGGKHELLLALFEESVRSTADRLHEVVAREDEALERLHRFVVEYYLMCRAAEAPTTAVSFRPPLFTELARQLRTTHPKEMAGGFVPLVSLFEELLDDASAAEAIRDDLRRGPMAGVVLEMIMFNAFSSTIGGSVRSDDHSSAEEMWRFMLHGIGNIPPA
jgi:AcrR family transcriptional regulator